jgi:hypothetical protein
MFMRVPPQAGLVLPRLIIPRGRGAGNDGLRVALVIVVFDCHSNMAVVASVEAGAA